MLWKKESNKPNALYVDIFALSKLDLEVKFQKNSTNNRVQQKDDVIALENRNDGNAAFRRKEYNDAMELYNDSLRFAKPGSELISLAYANRSTCFLKMEMFEKCLNDIKLAKDAGYPEHLMPKLNQRKTECLEQLENSASARADIGAELSFEPNENFPCMANALKVQQADANERGNCMVVAKQDIDVGQTVVIEKAILPFPYKRFGFICNICMKRNDNLMPCKTCTEAMFCPDCEGHFLHEYECGLNIHSVDGKDREALDDVRSILMSIKAFPTVDEFMEFIERIQKEKKMPTDLTNFQSKYQVYFNGSNSRNGICITDVKSLATKIYPVYRTMLQLPQIKAMFQSQKHLRFLMHLIGHTMSILKFYGLNNKPAKPRAVKGVGIKIGENGQISCEPLSYNLNDSDPRLFTQFYPTLKFIQHSCYPNLLITSANGKLFMVAARPIKQGEQVLSSHIDIGTESTSERQKMLQWMCQCLRCKGIYAGAEQREKLSSEPAFIELMAYSSEADDNSEQMMEQCEMLLQKYGHMDWCEEMNKLLKKYYSYLGARITKG